MASLFATPGGRSGNDTETETSLRFYLHHTFFAPQQPIPSVSSSPNEKNHPQHQTRLQRSTNPIVPKKDTQQIRPPHARLFRNQTPPSVTRSWLAPRAQTPKQPNRKNSPRSAVEQPSPRIPSHHTNDRVSQRTPLHQAAPSVARAWFAPKAAQTPKQPSRKNSPYNLDEHQSTLGNATEDPVARNPLYQLPNDKNTLLFDHGYGGSGAMEDVRRQIVDQYIVDQYIACTSDRRKEDSISQFTRSNHTKDNQGTTQVPRHQLQNNTNTRLFDSGYCGNGMMEDIRNEIVDHYVTGKGGSESVEAPSALPDCEFGLSHDHRRISSLTVQSQVAPRAPGEDRSFNTRPRGHRPFQRFFHDYFETHVVPAKREHKQQIENDPLPRKGYQEDKEVPSLPSQFVYDSIPIEEHPEDMEAPSSPSQYKESKLMIPTKTPTFPKNVFRSFVSTTASDDRSKASQKTIKSILSAKFAVVLPSRRSGSANHPLVRSEPLPEDELQEGHKLKRRFFSVSACLCFLMILAAILFVSFVPRGAGKKLLPKAHHPKVHVDHHKEEFHNIFAGKI